MNVFVKKWQSLHSSMNERSPMKQKLKNSRHRESLVGNNFLELAENSFAHPAESERFEEQQLPPEEQKKSESNEMLRIGNVLKFRLWMLFVFVETCVVS